MRADDVFLPWDTTAATLLARIAEQGNTIAVLVEGRHELDAEMVMRSLLEHTTLFAWLAITPDDNSRDWKARDPEQNTLWWMIDQYEREKKLTEDQETWLGGVLDEPMRQALRTMKKRVNALPSRGEFPSVRMQAAEVDGHWAPRLDGWYRSEPKTPGFAITFRGHYWTLYTRGSTSVHPDWGAIRRFLRPPSRSGYQRHYLEPEETGEDVGVFAKIAPYLMADAIAVADAALGWQAYDDALRVLGRWEEVRAPGLLAAGIRMLLGGQDGRQYGRAGSQLVSVEMTEGEVAIVVIEDASNWTRLSHRSGTHEWKLVNEHEEEITPGAIGANMELGPAVMMRVELLAEAEWLSGADKPSDWPDSAP